MGGVKLCDIKRVLGTAGYYWKTRIVTCCVSITAMYIYATRMSYSQIDYTVYNTINKYAFC